MRTDGPAPPEPEVPEPLGAAAEPDELEEPAAEPEGPPAGCGWPALVEPLAELGEPDEEQADEVEWLGETLQGGCGGDFRAEGPPSLPGSGPFAPATGRLALGSWWSLPAAPEVPG